MTKRRDRGDGGLYWNEKRQRWIGSVTVGYTPAGKRIVKWVSGKTKTEASKKLRGLVQDHRDDDAIESNNYTVEKAVRDWLKHGLNGRSQETVSKLTSLADTHVIPDLGSRKLRTDRAGGRSNNLTADDVDEWLLKKAQAVSKRTLQDLRAILRRSINRAVKRNKVKRNVVLLCEDLPDGKVGRPSKSLTFAQAEALVKEAEADESTMGAYIVVSLLGGVRTEEARPLCWGNVDLIGRPDDEPTIPPHVQVVRSVRASGDTKTRKSRRSVALAPRAVRALKAQAARQKALWDAAGRPWDSSVLVFASESGTQMDAANVRRGFRRIAKRAGLDAGDWTPRELRHSFVSLLSDSGVPIELISRLVGHSSTAVTEEVYRHQIRPVVQDGATAMDRLFPDSAA
ncbi:tyrosine recombinase XerC [Actinokineospora soli]|uniref:Tyrosine recombinase XerC n=1 Tax=Actinokineospora soli TaxID=1048753 RepID=A0ABW2TGC7_9PSEU